MNRILVSLAFVAMSAAGFITAASAEAGLFVVTATTQILKKAHEPQKLTTHAGTVECTTDTGTGTMVALHALTLRLTDTFSGCKAFGLAATVSPAEFEFSADGTIRVLKTITIKAIQCLVTVSSAKNTSLSTIKYTNVTSGVIVQPEITGITSSGTGAACEYAEESKGTYLGRQLLATDAGAALTWVNTP